MDARAKTVRVARPAGAVGRKQPTEMLERLMQAAFDAFAAYGYEGASMREIARQAGTTIQRISYHVSSKEELWKQVLSRLVDRYELRRQALIQSLGDAPAAVKLRHIITDMVEYISEVPGIYHIMTAEAARTSERLTWLCDTYLIPWVRDTVALIEQAQRDGAVRRVDPARLHYAMLAIGSMPFAVAAEFKATTGYDPFRPEEIQKTIDFICELVFVKQPTARSGPGRLRRKPAAARQRNKR
jgi:TetR/AcrR family transcriptional regulator